MDCFGAYFTHAQSCDNVRVHSATQWTASVHTLHMPTAVITFMFKVLQEGLLRYIHMPKAVTTFVFKVLRSGLCFRRFRVFVFSRFRAWRFRVFAFSCSAGGTPAAGTQISCAQLIPDYHHFAAGQYERAPARSFESFALWSLVARRGVLRSFPATPVKCHSITHFGGSNIANVFGEFLSGFPCKISAFFGLVSYNDPCLVDWQCRLQWLWPFVTSWFEKRVLGPLFRNQIM